MASLSLVEHYTSVQGEGPRTGILTQFVRFAGCNMRCPGWPCDTPHAIEPAIYINSKWNSTVAGLYAQCVAKAGKNICLTGGEPLIQPFGPLQEFVEQLAEGGYTIECFTNGSVRIPEWARVMSFVMDWKLAGSGEGDTGLDVRHENAHSLRRTDSIKFVVADHADLAEALQVYSYLLSTHCEAQFWVAPAWGLMDPEVLVDWLIATETPWRLNLQTHKYIWDAEETGV